MFCESGSIETFNPTSTKPTSRSGTSGPGRTRSRELPRPLRRSPVFVDPVAPRAEVLCTTLVGDPLERPDRHAIVQRNGDGSHLAGIGGGVLPFGDGSNKRSLATVQRGSPHPDPPRSTPDRDRIYTANAHCLRPSSRRSSVRSAMRCVPERGTANFVRSS